MFCSHEELIKFSKEYRETGTVMIPAGKIFLADELHHLEALKDILPEEYVQLGDAGEPNDLYVKRVLVDYPGQIPKQVNGKAAKQIFDILNDKNKQTIFSVFLGKKGYIRRCQINKMKQGSFIGRHLDTDSNPDYLVSIVIQLGHQFEGGAFVTHKQGSEKRHFYPPFGSVIISNCAIPHEVLPVSEGERVSLVYFYSFNEGINKQQKMN